MKKLWGAFVLGLLALASPAMAEDYLVVANGVSNDLSIIRTRDHVLLGKVPVTDVGKIDDVVATPDGGIFLANVQMDVDPEAQSATGGVVIAISTRTGEKLWTATMPGNPHHITLSADGSELFVPIYEQQYLLILDTKTGKETGKLYGRWGMHTTRLSNNGKLLYAGSILTGQVHAFDIAARKRIATYTFSGGEFGGIGVRPFTSNADESVIYAQLSGFHGIAVLDTARNEVTRFVRHGDLPADFKYPKPYPFNVDHGLELSPDGKWLVAVSEATEAAYIYSAPDLQLKKRIPLGRLSKWVVFSRDGAFVYASNAGDGDVSVISMKSFAEVARVKTGGIGGARMKVFDIPAENIPALLKQR
ncbi:MAG: hypothetical protein EOP61_02265 [Sphingomonadales bacterium]|nr:MAG: hypothetical protein EOP61_02265 [Sphingomonadales bacterium]